MRRKRPLIRPWQAHATLALAAASNVFFSASRTSSGPLDDDGSFDPVRVEGPYQMGLLMISKATAYSLYLSCAVSVVTMSRCFLTATRNSPVTEVCLT